VGESTLGEQQEAEGEVELSESVGVLAPETGGLGFARLTGVQQLHLAPLRQLQGFTSCETESKEGWISRRPATTLSGRWPHLEGSLARCRRETLWN
jgi:hypothetical protein